MSNQDSKVKPFQSSLSESLRSISQSEQPAKPLNPSNSSNPLNSSHSKTKCVILPIPKEIIRYKALITLFAFFIGFKHNAGFNYKHFAIAALFPEIYIVYIFAINKKVMMT